jgi:methyltransferase (TIGR00027 family)
LQQQEAAVFKSLTGVTYSVPDLDKAKQWYCQILNMEPVIDSPFTVQFLIGDFRLALVPTASPIHQGDEQTVAYWWVDDIDAAYRHLLDCGATIQTEIKPNPILKVSLAAVIDPFGNILGVMGKAPAAEQTSLENMPSASARNVAVCRAVAACAPTGEIPGPDHLAEIFLPEDARKALKIPAARALMLKQMAAFSPGGYEFFIARTAYLDGVVEQALRNNIPQIVLMGAGYDTRAIRFQELIQDTRIFELDTRATQQHKRARLADEQVTLPEQLVFLTVDFTRDDLAEMLVKAGFDPDKQTLFIWEGVSYYLPPKAVDDTLNLVRRHSPAGSTICFDYMYPAAELDNRFGAKKSREAMQTAYTAEPLQFDLSADAVAAFLAERGYAVVDHLTAGEMEKRYLTLPDGSLAGQILDLFGLVRASVRA